MTPRLNIPEVAALFRQAPKTIRKKAKFGRIPAKKFGRDWRFRQSDIARTTGEKLT